MGTTHTQESLNEIFERYDNFEDELSEKGRTAWNDYSEESVELQLNTYRSLQDAINNLSKDSLSETDAINLEMLSYILADEIFHLEYESYLMPLNSEGGFVISMMYGTSYVRLLNDKAIENYTAKLKDVPRYIDQRIDLMRRGIQENKMRPKLVVNNCTSILKDFLSYSGESFFLFKPFTNAGITPNKELVEEIIRSFSKLQDFLEGEYLEAAPEELGISKVNDGMAFYLQRVQYFTSLDMHPMQVYEIGISEVQRIKSEMEAVLATVEFDGDLQEFIEYLRTDEKFYAKTPEELLYYAAWLSKKAEEILPKYFTKLPRLPFTVSPVAPEIAPNYTVGRYSGGSMHSQKPGQYLVNTYKYDTRPLYLMPALTLHEAVPGHHLQISLAKEIEDLPSFRSYYLSAFGEGWGLYAEYLGKEAGIYETAYEEFGRLCYEMWRACRLVIDPGIHFFGWSREQAVNYMRKHTSLSFHEIETEINRYIGWPGQAVSYKIGELKIRELRNRAEEDLGEDFDIREFHDLILSNGSIPLNSLERIINKYIENKNSDE